jgi:flagellar motor switch protein FliG
MNVNPLSGPEKAAVLLLALDEDVAAEVMSHLDEAQLRLLAERAGRLGSSAAGALEATFEEFDRLMRSPGPLVPAAAGAYFKTLAARALGAERAEQLLSPQAPLTAPIETLRSARPESLAELLADEHPHLAAVILAQLPKEQAAKVLAALSAEVRHDVLSRLATLTELPTDTVELASEALAKSLAHSGAAGTTRSFDGVTFAAGMLNQLTREESDELLSQLAQRSEKAAAQVREAMFTFEDLGKLEPRAVQALMREVAPDQLVIALKTASEQLRNLFLGAISSRAAAALRDDLSLLPPMRLSEVETAQRAIVEAAMRLADSGAISLPSSSGEKMV